MRDQEESENYPDSETRIFRKHSVTRNFHSQLFRLYPKSVLQHIHSYHMNDNNLGEYVEALRKEKVEWIHGYPSAINVLADAEKCAML